MEVSIQRNVIGRTINHTPIEVSTIGLGTTKFGRNTGVKYPINFDLPSNDRILELLQIAQTSGINLIDTAPAYGSSEERIGQILHNKNTPSEIRNRDNWVIATKVGELFDGSKSQFDFSASATIKSLQESLKRLNTDFIDITNIHSDGNDVQILESEIWEVLKEAKAQGLTRAIGASIKTLDGLKWLINNKNADIAMVEYNSKSPEKKQYQQLFKQAYKEGLGIIIKKSLGSGHLIKNANKTNGCNTIDTIPPTAITEQIKFCLKESIHSVVIGTITPRHLVENIKAAKLALSSNSST